MTSPRIVALDIDGTLINSAKQIMDFTKSELHRVVDEYGVRIVLITARGPKSTAVIEERLGLRSSYITYGGALVSHRTADGFETVAEATIAVDAVRAVVAVALDSGVHVGVYGRQDWFVSGLDYWGLREARNTAVWPSDRTLHDALRDDARHDLFKVMLRGEVDSLAVARDHIRSLQLPLFVHANKRVIEVFSDAAIKLPALAKLGDASGFTLDEVIAFGDSESDVPMLEGCGVGVLMGNANPELDVAPHVERTLSNDEDGIGIMLRKHFPSPRPFLP